MAKPEVILLTIPAVGHLKPTVELAKLLLSASPSPSPISVTILLIPSFIPSWDSAAAPSISSAAGISIEVLPLVPTAIRDAEFPDAHFARFIHNHNPHVRAALDRRLAAKTRPIAALILDVFCWPAIDIARDLGLPAYVFVTWNAAMLSFMLHLPFTPPPPAFNTSEVINVPGMCALPASCTPGFLLDESAREVFAGNGRKIREAAGLILNSFQELEPALLEAIAGGKCVPQGETTPPVFAVGPVLAMWETEGGGETKNQCLEWLDAQPEGSVVFLCLGSNGCTNVQQAEEVATALEHSGQRFLWVLRTPVPDSPLSFPELVSNVVKVLPNGFIGRTKDKGMVWPTWAPQMKILSHRAIGGFLTHCGWNSCLESFLFRVPMLTWPLNFDQPINAFYLAHQLQLGMELKVDRKNRSFVAAAELERGLKSLMGEEGRRVRQKMEAVGLAMRRAMVDRDVMRILVNKIVNECPKI